MNSLFSSYQHLNRIRSTMSEVVVLILASDLTVATIKTRQPRNFKWDEETDLIFLQSVRRNKAYIKSADKLEV